MDYQDLAAEMDERDFYRNNPNDYDCYSDFIPVDYNNRRFFNPNKIRNAGYDQILTATIQYFRTLLSCDVYKDQPYGMVVPNKISQENRDIILAEVQDLLTRYIEKAGIDFNMRNAYFGKEHKNLKDCAEYLDSLENFLKGV